MVSIASIYNVAMMTGGNLFPAKRYSRLEMIPAIKVAIQQGTAVGPPMANLSAVTKTVVGMPMRGPPMKDAQETSRFLAFTMEPSSCFAVMKWVVHIPTIVKTKIRAMM